jgi:hypothetical protein
MRAQSDRAKGVLSAGPAADPPVEDRLADRRLNTDTPKDCAASATSPVGWGFLHSFIPALLRALSVWAV